jgi:class 3 adenylate cyclase
VATPCRTCGAEPRDGARFCDACGSPFVVEPEQAEYKQVTVLFADVVHSMDIAAAVGAERLREIMTDLFKRSALIVERYGGTVDKFTGDGIMALFGAPVALEDHAARACRSALDIQAEVRGLAAEVERRDDISLRLRIGLNSGRVIAGQIGSRPLSYTAVGAQVGLAQRMESVAPAGGVMITDSTARLVDHVAMLGEPELVHIKGSSEPIPARRLLGMAIGRRSNRAETTFVGRHAEMNTLSDLLDRSINAAGHVVSLVGPPGIGKSRIIGEITSQARRLDVEVFSSSCESHTTDVPFYVVDGLLAAMLRTDGSAHASAAGMKAAMLAHTAPAMYVIDDVHWIDTDSEAVLAECLAGVAETHALVLLGYRPEYDGALAHTSISHTIRLEPLDDSHMSMLSSELLGKDRSVSGLTDVVVKRAAGNPFFAEELVRDLNERDVLIGGRGCYLCVDPVADVSVPSSLQAVIAARIDRLSPAAKRTLNAAAVIGSTFEHETLTALGIEPAMADLVRAELVDQIGFSPRSEYTFRHPLIRAVAYESQLKSDRAQLHRRLAAMLEHDDRNSALVAEHLHAAGDVHIADDWRRRA